MTRMVMKVDSCQDALFLIDAVQAHGQRLVEGYRDAYLKARRRGWDEDARQAVALKIDAELAWRRAEARLLKILDRLEASMEAEPAAFERAN